MRGGIAGLVDVGLGLEVFDTDVGDILFELATVSAAERAYR